MATMVGTLLGGKGRTVTLQHAKYDAGTNTLDLTRVRLSVAQFVAAMLLVGGFIASQAVLAWRLNEMQASLTALKEQVHALELTGARNEGGRP